MLTVSGELLPSVLGPLDRFEVIAPLGRGSHGVVYEALDREQGVRVALKTLRVADAHNLLRLKREFRELVSLHHPNLVELGELFEDQGRWFFSMRLVQGVDWSSHVRGCDADDDVTITTSRSVNMLNFDEVRLRAALAQLGHGLQALHEAGKLHRDIKPSNIRVQPNGQLVLLDFGLVATLSENSETDVQRAVGTVAYMSPEQAAVAPLSAASDCYAVGMLLYEALTGVVPFEGSLLEILTAKQSKSPRIPEERASRLPADLVDLCHALCQIEPELRPSAAELAARAQGKLPHATHVPLVRKPSLCAGRERELAALSGALKRVSQGELAQVCVFGEPGIGKSTLLSAWVEQVLEVEPELCVLSGGCHERERVPYKALDALIDALGERLSRMTHEQCVRLVPRHAAALAHIFPVLDRLCSPDYGLATSRLPADPIVLRTHAYGALRELLTRLSQHAPVVMVLDDLQWSDNESLALLGALMQAPSPPRLLVITASWPLDRCSSWLRDKLAELMPTATAIALGALTPTASHELVAHVIAREGGQLDAARAEAIAANGGYHPLFIEWLARAAVRGAGGHASLDQTLHAEILQRTPEARYLLQLTAVAGAPISLPVLQRAAQLSAAESVQALAELRTAGLIVLHDGSEPARVAIYHTQIRDVVCGRLDQESTRALHGALAQALAEAPSRDYEALAVHWQGANCPHDAMLCFAQAAEQADRARAFGHAAILYEQALRCADGLALVERSSWELHHAAALANAGRCAEAAHAYLRAAKSLAPHPAREALRAAARHFLSAGDVARGLEIAGQLLREVGEQVPRAASGALASLVWQRARLGVRMRDLRDQADPLDRRKALACDLLFDIATPLGMLDLTRSCDLHARSLRLALELGDPARMARGLAVEAMFGEVRTTASELRCLGILTHAEHLAQRSGEPHLIAWVKLCSASRNLMNGEPRLALTEADLALQLFEDQCRDVAWQIGSAYAVSLSALTSLGDFIELERRYPAAVDAVQQRGNVASFVTLVSTNRCLVDLVADRPEQCRALLEEVSRAWPADREMQHTYLLCGQILIDLYGGGDAAHRRIEQAWPALRRQLSSYNARISILLTIARAVAALAALAADGCNAAARLRLVQKCAARLLRERPRDARASGHFLLAQLSTWQGEREPAIHHYRLAEALWEDVGIYLRWVARHRRGELIGGETGALAMTQAVEWARSQKVVQAARFFAISAPITGSLLGTGFQFNRKLHRCTL